MIKMQTFLCDGDQVIGGYGNPYLRLDGVLAGAKEHLDSQVLLDPLEEQLHLPALVVQVGNQLRLHGEIIGQQRQAFCLFVFGRHTAQRCGVVLVGMIGPQQVRLIPDHRCVGPVHGMRVIPFELGVALSACHKQCLGLVNHEKPGELQIAPINQVKRPRLQHQIVQRIDLVRLALGDVSKALDVGAQIQQCVQFDGGFSRAKRCALKLRQTQGDGAGIGVVDRGIEFQPKLLLRIQRTCRANQVLGEVGLDLPKPFGVRIGQRVARDRLAAKPHLIKQACLSTQVEFDVVQRLSVGQLGKGHRKELVQALEVHELVFAPMVGQTAPKCVQRQTAHESRKYEFALASPRQVGGDTEHDDFRRKAGNIINLHFDVGIET